MNIIEVEEFLKANKYLLSFKGQLVLTSKFIRDVAAARTNSTSTAVAIIPQNTNHLAIATRIETPKDIFKRFIAEAEVPYRVSNSDGRSYTCNAPSDAAVRIFNRLLDSGTHNYQALVMSTKLYYRSNAFKQKISNYFVTGTWESEYNEFMKKFAAGTLEQHIQQQIKPSTGERKMI